MCPSWLSVINSEALLVSCKFCNTAEWCICVHASAFCALKISNLHTCMLAAAACLAYGMASCRSLICYLIDPVSLIGAGDSEEESEGEELRKAAKAYTAANKRAKSQPEVIVLDDSSDDEPPANLHRPVHASTQPSLVSSPHSHQSSRQQHSSQPSTGQSAGSAGNHSSASLSQSGGWAQASSSRQLPASLQSNSAGTAKPGSGLRIKLNTNSARHLQQQQQQQQSTQGGTDHQMTNGHAHGTFHPADPASSSSRLAAATMRPPVPRTGPGPSNLRIKRKHYELEGQYGSYSQASAQAAGMSMSDHVQQAANRSGSRLPPYPDTSMSYGSRGQYVSGPGLNPAQSSQPLSQSTSAYGQYPISPNYWQHQQPMGSPAYGSGMPASPPYSPQYPSTNGNLQALQRQQHSEQDLAQNAALLHSMQQQPAYGSVGDSRWTAQPLADGEL